MTVNTACAHKHAVHEHGTHACYVLDACRCDECRQANSDYEKSRRLWLGEFPRQEPPLVDAALARELVKRLTSAGIGLKTIAAQSGVAHGALWKLVYGKNGRPSRRVRRETMAKLEAYARVAEPADGAKVPAVAAWLIIDELRDRGWTKAAIARQVHGPDAVALQLSPRHVFYRNLKTLHGLLSEPVPPRRSRHGEHPVSTGHVWQTWHEIMAPIRREPEPPKSETLVGRRVLACEVCGRPLIDHGLLERCV